MTVGSFSQGARVVTAANFAENSPNDRCCDRSWTSPNAAMSQNAVVPPLPRDDHVPVREAEELSQPGTDPPHEIPYWRLPVRCP